MISLFRVRPLSREEVRGIDQRAIQEFGLPTLVLMENAGRGAAEFLLQRFGRGRLTVVCGSGNNGGDGGVVARHWDAWGLETQVLWLAPPRSLAPDAQAQHTILERSGVSQQVLDPSSPDDLARLRSRLEATDWIVDAIFGTGLSRPVVGPLLEVIARLNSSGKPILALDLPSGLDADTGLALGAAVRAAATATFVAPKIGFQNPRAHEFTGEVHVVDIGAPGVILRAFAQGKVH